MSLFLPNKYYKNIYEINYKKLSNEGIKYILFDLDNTLVSPHDRKIDNKLKKLIKKLSKDFKIILMSNSPKNRLKYFEKELEVDSNSLSLKPLSIHFYRILKKYNMKKNEVCIVGDQMLTDILGGNRVGIKTILVDQFVKSDFILTKPNRKIEKLIEKRFLKKGLFERGKYYD